jgi:hypothetical protein
MIRRLILALLVLVVVLGVAVTAFGYWFLAGDGIRLAIESQASAWLQQPVRVGRARAHVFPGVRIALGDVSIGDPARLSLAEVDVSTDWRSLLSRTIDDATITVANSRLEMPLPFALPAGGASAAPSTGGDAAAGIHIASIRRISLEDVLIVSRGREVRVSAESALNGDRLTLQRFAARSGSTTLEASGEVDLAPNVEARLTMTANRLDVDELLALADAFTPPAQPGAARQSSSPVKITAQVNAETATAAGVEVRRFAAGLGVDGDRVSLAPLAFDLFGGGYQGSLDAQLGRTLAVTIRSRVENLDVAQLVTFGGAPNTISGRLTGSGTFSGGGADIAAVLRSARGMGTAAVVNGEIRRLNLVRTVVLFFGRPAPDPPVSAETAAGRAEGSDRFDRIDASFSLANQVFNADAFSLRSPDADMTGSMTLDVDTQALDGGLEMMLSEDLSKQAGTDLIRLTREGNRVVLPARIGGTIAAPRLTIDLAAAARRGLRNEIRRRLGDIFDGLGGR